MWWRSRWLGGGRGGCGGRGEGGGCFGGGLAEFQLIEADLAE